MANYLDSNGLLYLWQKIKNLVSNATSGKQDTLTTAQLNAANSGITAAKVTKYDDYEAKINGKAEKAKTLEGYGITDAYTKSETDSVVTDATSGKQDNLTTAQLNAVNSGITAAKVAKYDGYDATINGKAAKSTTLAGYGITDAYTKSETDSAINEAIGHVTQIDYQVVKTLPTTGTKGTIYLVSNSGTGSNAYDEYIWVNNAWEKIGTTAVDLSGYWAKADLVAITNAQIDTIVAS